MDSSAKTKRKQLITAVGGFSAVIVLMTAGMWLSDPNRGKPTPQELRLEKANEVMKDFTAKSSGSVSAEETWIALSEKELKQLKTENKNLRDQLDEIHQLLKSLREQEAVQGTPVSAVAAESGLPLSGLPPTQVEESGNGFGPRPAIQKSQSDGSAMARNLVDRALPPPPPPPARIASGQITNPNGEQGSAIQVVDLSDGTGTEDNDTDQKKNVRHYLPTGAFATAVLLSGMDAPTGGQAKTNPVPVLMRVMDNGQLPNFFQSEVKDCHVTGAAYGDISSERANIRLEVLTCVLLNGDIIEEKVSGYVAGEDGKAGLRGRLVSKQGALIAKSLLAGIPSGMASSLSQQYQQISTSALGNVTTLDPDKVAENGLAEGASNSLEKIADYYIARANETYPIIEVDANRIGEIILTGGTDLGASLIGNTRKRRK